jgi:4-amino-4-deoxychorismate lyase
MAIRTFTSIKVVDGKMQLQDWHLRRINEIFYKHGHPKNLHSSLEDALMEVHYELPRGVNKLRLWLTADRVEYTDCTPYALKKINRVVCVDADDVDYSFKHQNRDAINALKQQYAPNDDEEILMVQNGFVTDTSYSNVCFWDGTKWITPKTHLLNGIKRQYLLAAKQIVEKEITVKDIYSYEKMALINAMIELEEVMVPIENIVLA